mgnify:CR=1 FL=1
MHGLPGDGEEKRKWLTPTNKGKMRKDNVVIQFNLDMPKEKRPTRMDAYKVRDSIRESLETMLNGLERDYGLVLKDYRSQGEYCPIWVFGIAEGEEWKIGRLKNDN